MQLSESLPDPKTLIDMGINLCFVIYALASTCRVERILHCENTTILERACIVVDLKNTGGPAMACC